MLRLADLVGRPIALPVGVTPTADDPSQDTTPGDQGRLIDRPASPCPARPGRLRDDTRVADQRQRSRAPRASHPDPARDEANRPPPPRRGDAVGGDPGTRPAVQPTARAGAALPGP